MLAVLLAMVALAAGVAPRESSSPGGSTGAGTAEPVAQASGNVQKTLDAAATGQRVVARVGQLVMLTVRSPTLTTVSIAELGDRTAEPDSPAHFELFADVAGTYPIDALESGQQIGTLEIRGSR